MRFVVSFMLLWTLSAPSPAAVELPDMGKSADRILSPAEEDKLGEEFMRQLRQSDAMLDDMAVDAYLNALGYRLVAHSDNPTQRFTFFTMQDNTINAFAVPGGYIGIHSGLLLHTREESELASVVAHEIAHVTQHHIARTLEKSSKFSLPALAGMIAAIAIGVNNPEMGQAALAALTAGSIQMQLNFTRQHEREADRVGMQILAGAGFDPHSMPIFFAKMQDANRFYGTHVPEFLRSHPVTTDRIAEAEDRARQFTAQAKQEDTPLFYLMRARVLVLTTQDHDALIRQLEKALTDGHFQDERAVRYALVLAMLAAHRHQDARSHLTWLKQQDADRVLYHLAEAELALAEKQPATARRICQKALEIYPGDKLLSLRYADSLLQNAAPAQAVEVLQAIPRWRVPAYYELLAKAQKAAGKPVESLLAMAEAYYLQGRTKPAVEQLKQAQKQKNTGFYLSAKVEARLKDLLAVLEEEENR